MTRMERDVYKDLQRLKIDEDIKSISDVVKMLIKEHDIKKK